MGHNALSSVTTNTGTGGGGSYNTAFGSSALTANLTGEGNVAVGGSAGLGQTTGEKNVWIGGSAGAAMNGDKNVAVGSSAMYGVGTPTGDFNVAMGYQAMKGATAALTGDNNVAVGKDAGLILQGAAHSNTFIGTTSGNVATTAVENTCLGFNADIQDATATNQIVIGNNVTGTADNAVHIGNDTSHIRCDFNSDQTWDASSDKRQKKDIKESELGLAFINDLKPSKYRHKSPSEFPEEWKAHNPDDKEPMGGSDKYYYGFIAQEVKDTIDKHDAPDYGAWNVDNDGRQRVSREQFVVSLVKAVQELSLEVNNLKQQLKEKS